MLDLEVLLGPKVAKLRSAGGRSNPMEPAATARRAGGRCAILCSCPGAGGCAPTPKPARTGFPSWSAWAESLQVQQRGPAKGISFPPGPPEMKGRRGPLRLLRAAVLKLQVTTRLKPSGEQLNGSRLSVDFSGAWPWGPNSPALLPPQPRSPDAARRAAARPTGTGSPGIKRNAEALYPQRPL